MLGWDSWARLVRSNLKHAITRERIQHDCFYGLKNYRQAARCFQRRELHSGEHLCDALVQGASTREMRQQEFHLVSEDTAAFQENVFGMVGGKRHCQQLQA